MLEINYSSTDRPLESGTTIPLVQYASGHVLPLRARLVDTPRGYAFVMMLPGKTTGPVVSRLTISMN